MNEFFSNFNQTNCFLILEFFFKYKNFPILNFFGKFSEKFQIFEILKFLWIYEKIFLNFSQKNELISKFYFQDEFSIFFLDKFKKFSQLKFFKNFLQKFPIFWKSN